MVRLDVFTGLSGRACFGPDRLSPRVRVAGVRKKHSLTYSTPAVQSWARFDLNTATCNWTASSRVLKDWMAHFHERTGGAGAGGGGGAGGSGTDEVTFYCSRGECRLKSFNDVDRCRWPGTVHGRVRTGPLTSSLLRSRSFA